VIPAAIFRVVDDWVRWRAVVQGGSHILPVSGGMLDQPAALIEAYEILDFAMSRKQSADGGRSQEDRV
jgi:hypothetical protein